MSTTYTAIFENHIDARHSLEGLLAAGFEVGEISVLMNSATGDGAFEIKSQSKALEGVAAGGVAGGAVGALIGGLTAVGIIGTGGLGLLAVGPAIGALTMAGAGAGVGGALGGLIGLGVPEHEARFVEDRLTQGDVLVAVTCEDADRAADARAILASCPAATVTRG